MQTPPLNQSVGSSERAMRALLERQLREADLSFPEWTALVFTNASPLMTDQVSQRQIDGHVVSNAEDSLTAIKKLVAAGMLSADESGLLSHTDTGSALFKRLSSKIKDITDALYGDLPVADLEATHRTLLEIAKRANSLLSASKV